jgi:hypothetical protein
MKTNFKLIKEYFDKNYNIIHDKTGLNLLRMLSCALNLLVNVKEINVEIIFLKLLHFNFLSIKFLTLKM